MKKRRGFTGRVCAVQQLSDEDVSLQTLNPTGHKEQAVNSQRYTELNYGKLKL